MLYRRVCVSVKCKHVTHRVPQDSSGDIREKVSLWQRAALYNNIILLSYYGRKAILYIYKRTVQGDENAYNNKPYRRFRFVCVLFSGLCRIIYIPNRHAHDDDVYATLLYIITLSSKNAFRPNNIIIMRTCSTKFDVIMSCNNIFTRAGGISRSFQIVVV